MEHIDTIITRVEMQYRADLHREPDHAEVTSVVTEYMAKVATYDPMPSQVRLGSNQLDTALRLAQEFGHEWAYAELVRDYGDPDRPPLGSPFAIEVAVMALGRIYNHTILAGAHVSPGINKQGDIVHVTMNERFAWEIDGSGNVHATINRPAGIALGIFIGNYVPSEGRSLFVERGNVPVHPRHVDAAFKVIKTLCGPYAAFWSLKDMPVDPEPEKGEAREKPHGPRPV